MTFDMPQYLRSSFEEFEPTLIREVPCDDSTSPEEKHILMDEIRKRKAKIIVETGTHKGLTTCYLAFAALDTGGHVYTYDPYEWGAAGNFDKFDWLPITYHQKPGKDIEQDSIDFAFIDGFHEKVEVLAEIDTLLPRLAPGAVVYFHDTNGSNPSCDVTGALDERGMKYELLKTLNGMAKYEHKDIGSDNDSTAGRTRGSSRKSTKADVS